MERKTIINTRPLAAEDHIAEALEEMELDVVSMPLTEISPLPISHEMEEEIFVSKKYDWLVFTSQNGVNCFFDAPSAKGWTGNLPFRIAVFGERTAQALLAKDRKPDILNRGNTALELLPELLYMLSSTEKVLLVLGDLAPDTLLQELSERVDVTRLNVYSTVAVKGVDESILERIGKDEYDLILFTSPSGVRSFVQFAQERLELSLLRSASLGPSTTQALLKANIRPRVEAIPSDKEGLVTKIKEYFSAANR